MKININVQLKLSVFLIKLLAVLAAVSLNEDPQNTNTSEFFASNESKNKNKQIHKTNKNVGNADLKN